MNALWEKRLTHGPRLDALQPGRLLSRRRLHLGQATAERCPGRTLRSVRSVASTGLAGLSAPCAAGSHALAVGNGAGLLQGLAGLEPGLQIFPLARIKPAPPRGANLEQIRERVHCASMRHDQAGCVGMQRDPSSGNSDSTSDGGPGPDRAWGWRQRRILPGVLPRALRGRGRRGSSL